VVAVVQSVPLQLSPRSRRSHLRSALVQVTWKRPKLEMANRRRRLPATADRLQRLAKPAKTVSSSPLLPVSLLRPNPLGIKNLSQRGIHGTRAGETLLAEIATPGTTLTVGTYWLQLGSAWLEMRSLQATLPHAALLRPPPLLAAAGATTTALTAAAVAPQYALVRAPTLGWSASCGAAI
jgi:hypothetical protein